MNMKNQYFLYIQKNNYANLESLYNALVKAHKELNDSSNKQRKELEEKTNEAELYIKKYTELQQDLKGLTNERESHTKHIKDLTANIQKLEDTISLLEDSNKSVIQQRIAQEQRIQFLSSQLRKEKSEHDDTRKMLEYIKSDAEQKRESAISYKDDILKMKNEIASNKSYYIYIYSVIDQLSSNIQSLQVENEDYKGRLSKYRSEMDSVRKTFVIVYAKICSIINGNKCIYE